MPSDVRGELGELVYSQAPYAGTRARAGSPNRNLTPLTPYTGVKSEIHNSPFSSVGGNPP